MTTVNRNGEVWIFAEQEAGKLSDVPLELMSRGRRLADELKVPLAAVLPGSGVKALGSKLVSHGADKVYIIDNEKLGVYQATGYSKTICDLVREHKPQIVLFGATPIGRDLAPHVASALKCGLTADCTDLEIGDHTPPGSTDVHKNLLLQIRPAFGGNIIATIVNYDRWPQMATVREGVMRLEEGNPQRSGKIIEEKIEFSDFDMAIKLIERHREKKKVNLKAARMIVAGGGGVGSKANFKLIHELAGVLGAAVGASRAAIDSGFIGKEHQIGQTGTTVRPALYIACGISGAVQHRAGMEESAKIIAINWDKEAPIFGVAHYGIVGDLAKVIPMMIKAIRARG